MSSRTGDIHNDDSLFQFDPYDSRQSTPDSPSLLPVLPRPPAAVTPPRTMSSHDAPLTSAELDDGSVATIRSPVGKGKERTMPMPIRASTIVHDLFDMPSPSTSSYRAFPSSPSSVAMSPASSSSLFSPGYDSDFRARNISVQSMEDMDSNLSPESPSGKGKEREPYPYLPPLSFSVIKLDYRQDHDLASTPGSSSYGTLYSPLPSAGSLPSPFNDRETPVPPPNASPMEPIPQVAIDHNLIRSRSLSNLSRPISPLLGTVSAAINLQTSFGPSRSPSNISRQLIFNQEENDNNASSLDLAAQALRPSSGLTKSDLLNFDRDPASYPSSWYTARKPVAGPTVVAQTGIIHSPSPRASLKAKVRSKSSPYPISVLDFIPNSSTDVFQPLPIVIVNYFDLFLPRELRLDILRALRDSHAQDYLRAVEEGRVSFSKATSSRGRWVGKDKGLRELFKLSRVSKGWRSLVFDGELWADVDLRSFHSLPPAVTMRLIQTAGTFVRNLNLAGHVQLNGETLSHITTSLCLSTPHVPSSCTQITRANFQGCTTLTTRSLHQFLVRSKSLQSLSVKGLSAVTNTTCEIIVNFCPNLVSLNLSRCPNVDGHGINSLTRERLLLKELRLSGVKYISDFTLQELGRAAPYLEVLDLSYCRNLHNSAIEAFIACDGCDEAQLGVDTILLSPRDLGRESNDGGKLKRRVTRLRHLILSSCLLLTDTACSNLAHSVPNLELFEMAGIGSDLKDAGLIRLLETTPHIRRLDLEDAIDISDAFLATITPPPADTSSRGNSGAPADDVKYTGYALQQLNVSYATRITDEAFLSLIRNCTKLTVLEADNTRMGTSVLKEFVRISRQRKAKNAKIVAVDCRGIHESLVKELSPMTRPRLGWRAYGARKLGYLDARDDNEDELKIGQDECDEQRVVLKTFYSWQTVDAVKAVREKRRKAAGASGRRVGSESSAISAEGEEVEPITVARAARWWSPGGRRSPRGGAGQDRDRNSPPILPDLNNDGCRTM